MTNSERASYIKGLMEGMELDPKAKETKLFNAIVELLDDLSVSVEELEDGYDELCEQVDEIDQDLGSLLWPGRGGLRLRPPSPSWGRGRLRMRLPPSWPRGRHF